MSLLNPKILRREVVGKTYGFSEYAYIAVFWHSPSNRVFLGKRHYSVSEAIWAAEDELRLEPKTKLLAIVEIVK